MGLLPQARVGRPATRNRLTIVAITVVLALLAGRLLWVQAVTASSRAAEAVKQRTSSSVVLAQRGEIRDRTGAVFAQSVARYDIWVNQRQVVDYRKNAKSGEKGVSAAAKRLATLLGYGVDETEDKLTGDSGFKYLKKSVTPAVRDAIMGLGIDGIGADEVSKRLYPNGQVAANVLGFLGSDGTPLAGLEMSLNDELAGRNGERSYERGADGTLIPTGRTSETPAVDGSDVILTIDRDLQYRAQDILQDTVEAYDASAAAAVVMNPKTGEIYALADYPTFDPNSPGQSDESARGNAAVSNVFEPGSTGKLFTFSALIDKGLVKPSDQYTVPWEKYFSGQRIKDSHSHATENWTLAGVLYNSSNVGTVMASEKIDDSVRYDYLRAFGFGQKTGLGFPGESSGILRNSSDWDARTRLTTTFGQGYAVTAVQMTSAVATLANDGVRVTPRLVAELQDADGNYREYGTQQETRVVSSSTADQMMQLMDTNVPDDGSHGADIQGYAVGGKSGTAQVADASGGVGGGYTASFMSVVPADDPQLVVGVFVYGLKTFISGTRAAAPATAQIGGFAVQTLGVAPTGSDGTELPLEW